MSKSNFSITNLQALLEGGLEAKKQGLGMIKEPGKYLCTIETINLTEAKGNETYADKTPQLEVVLSQIDGGKTINHWIALKAFIKFDSLDKAERTKFKEVNGYAVDKRTNERLVDEEKSLEMLEKVAKLGYACGKEEGEKFNVKDLEKSQVAIIVEYATDKDGNIKMNNRNEEIVEVRGIFRTERFEDLTVEADA